MGKAILITSCKGGVGKSTVSANLATAIAEMYAPTAKKHNGLFDDITQLNKRVLLIDCDFGVRSLDLLLGVENDNIYDLSDVLSEKTALEDAVRPVKGRNNLFVLAAPMAYKASEFPVDKFAAMVEQAKNEYEYIILDSAPAHAESFYVAQRASDSAIIITSSSSCSLRAASKTAEELAKLGCADTKLVINMFQPKSVLKKEYAGIMESINTSNAQLIGIIPFDNKICLKQEKGETLDFSKDKSAVAFTELANRVIGFNVPLPKRILGIKTKRLF